MKKSCAFSLLVWAACVAVYARLAWGRLHDPAPAAVIGVLGGTFAAILIGSIVGLFTGSSDGAALRRAERAEPPRDGRLEAASGPIRALGAPLEAPFTGRACVAYEYDVKPGEEGASDFAGVALTSCVVDGMRGPVRILGWAILDQFPAASGGEIDRARGEAYLRATPLEKLGLGGVLSVFKDLLTDDDGVIRKDYRIGDAEPLLAGKNIKEKIVPNGETVTVLGIWSDAKGGFTPSGRASMNRIYPEQLAALRAKLGGSSVRSFAIGLGFFVVLHAILVPAYILSGRRGRAAQSVPEAPRAAAAGPSVWDERDCDTTRDLLAKGADANERDSSGVSALMNASRYGNIACVEALLAAGADVDAKDKRGDTALAHAVTAGETETVALLKRSGAQDFRVTEENGRPVGADSEALAVVKQYVAAVQAGDSETMVRLLPGTSRARLDELKGENLTLWRSARPREVTDARGHESADAATIRVEGPGPDASRRVVMYHLQKLFEGWRITREWFPKEDGAR